MTYALPSVIGRVSGSFRTEKHIMRLSMFAGNHGPSERCGFKLEMCG